MRVRKRTALLEIFDYEVTDQVLAWGFSSWKFLYNVHDFAWASVLSRESHRKGEI